MVVMPVSDSSATVLDAASVRSRAQPLWGTTARGPDLVRMVAAAALTAVAFLTMYADLLANALDGSRAAYLVVFPVLLAVIAAGYRTAPRGVNDVESDWIVTALIGISGFVAIHLVNNRMPTLAGFWGLPLLGCHCGWAAWRRCCSGFGMPCTCGRCGRSRSAAPRLCPTC